MPIAQTTGVSRLPRVIRILLALCIIVLGTGLLSLLVLVPTLLTHVAVAVTGSQWAALTFPAIWIGGPLLVAMYASGRGRPRCARQCSARPTTKSISLPVARVVRRAKQRLESEVSNR